MNEVTVEQATDAAKEWMAAYQQEKEVREKAERDYQARVGELYVMREKLDTTEKERAALVVALCKLIEKVDLREF